MTNQEKHTLLIDKLILKQMLRSSLCDYSDAYILVKENISVNNTEADAAAVNKAIEK